MASVYSAQWVSNSPRLRLDYSVSYPDGDTGRITWTLYYDASLPASSSASKSYSVIIGGTTVKSGTYSVNGVTGTKQIATGTKDFDRTTSAINIKCYAKMDIKLTWSKSYKATITTTTGTATLDAKTSYTITFDDNGGSGGPETATKWYNIALTIPSTVPTRSGYTFVGWGTSTTDTDKDYAAGDTYPASSNAAATLYAIWKKTLTLSFSANGGGGSPASLTGDVYNATTSYTFTIPTTVPSLSLHEFLGWSTSAATSASYQPGATIAISADTTLYAVWKLAYIRPKVSQLSAYRANNSSGTFDDDGTYGYIVCSWAVDTTVVASRVCKKIVVRYKAQNASAWTEKSLTTSAYGIGSTSGTLKYSLSGLNTDYRYDIEVIIYDDYGSNEPAVAYISSSKMVIDVPDDDSGIGIFTPSINGTPDNPLMEVGLDAKFYKDVEVDGLIIEDGTALPNKYISGKAGAIDANTAYDGKMHMCQGGSSNLPSGSQYGVVLLLPYRKLSGNTKPDYAAQIFIPNGDDPSKPNSMFYRTSLAGSWNSWQEVEKRHKVLYDNSTGTYGTVTLTESAENFTMLEIIIGYSDIYGCNSIKIYNPNSKVFDISALVPSSTSISAHRTRCTISDTSITQNYNASGTISGTTWGSASNKLLIKSVIGYY